MPFPIYDTQEAVPQDMRDVYEQKDGKFHPKLPDVTTLESTLKKVRDEKKAADDARIAAETKAADLERKEKQRKDGLSDDELQRLKDAEEAAKKPLQEKLDATEAENRQFKLINPVQEAAAAAGVMGERLNDCLVLLGVKKPVQRVELTTDGTGFVVKDKDGKVTTETIEKLLGETLKAERAYLYDGVNATGTGSQESKGGGQGAYDPVKAGKEAAARQKQTADGAKNALR